MTYITREDGINFVIPSYRDVLTTKNKTSLKNEIVSLSKNYGEYITLQRKSATRYEVAFSPDRGYLLGESIWNYFKSPTDMVYCEVVPGTTEAILVIVKSGSVYLDGRFPTDTIPEELVVFLTEQNNFEIYVYGDVPIGQTPEDGKFSFDANSIKSFTILDKPIFPTLPLIKSYQFDLVNAVLKSQGIGVFPAKQVVSILVVIGVIWMMWSYFTAPSAVVEAPPPPPPRVNPYQAFYDNLNSPAPDVLINQFLDEYQMLFSLPGWNPKDAIFNNGTLTSTVQSQGSKLQNLYAWAQLNNALVIVRKDSVGVTIVRTMENRPKPQNIYHLKAVLVKLIDNLATIYPGNHLTLGDTNDHNVYYDMNVTINLDNVSPDLIRMIGQQLHDDPIKLQNITVSVNNGSLSGAINLMILGN